MIQWTVIMETSYFSCRAFARWFDLLLMFLQLLNIWMNFAGNRPLGRIEARHFSRNAKIYKCLPASIETSSSIRLVVYKDKSTYCNNPRFPFLAVTYCITGCLYQWPTHPELISENEDVLNRGDAHASPNGGMSSTSGFEEWWIESCWCNGFDHCRLSPRTSPTTMYSRPLLTCSSRNGQPKRQEISKTGNLYFLLGRRHFWIRRPAHSTHKKAPQRNACTHCHHCFFLWFVKILMTVPLFAVHFVLNKNSEWLTGHVGSDVGWRTCDGRWFARHRHPMAGCHIMWGTSENRVEVLSNRQLRTHDSISSREFSIRTDNWQSDQSSHSEYVPWQCSGDVTAEKVGKLVMVLQGMASRDLARCHHLCVRIKTSAKRAEL